MGRVELKNYNNLYDITERKKLISTMLTEFRKVNGYQQKEVAELIGIKSQTYNAYESGRNETPAEILVRLSILYDTPIDILVQRDNITKEEKSIQTTLNIYDKEIQGLREELLKGDPKAQEVFTKLLDGIQDFTNALRENSNK